MGAGGSQGWDVTAWADHLGGLSLPLKADSRGALEALEARHGNTVAPREYADLLLDDPLFALMLLKRANEWAPKHFRHDITTPLGVVLTVGAVEVRRLLETAPLVTGFNFGFLNFDRKATLAARLALAWGELRVDIDPRELALGVLLANAGELLLWVFAPELPRAALEYRLIRPEATDAQAEQAVCGFAFQELTLALGERWNLPELTLDLIRGEKHRRAQVARVTVATVGYLARGLDDPGLARSVLQAAQLMGASAQEAIAGLPVLDAEQQAELQRQVLRLMPSAPEAAGTH